MASKRKKILIIDGNALIHRSFHAIPPTLITKSGELVNAVYGFTNFLFKAIKEFKPEYVVLTLDKKGPTFRHEKFAQYKGTRVKAPDELYNQITRIKEVANFLNIPIFEKSGFEADDLIGTISELINDSIDSIIVTGDMDTLQLVDDSTFVYTMSRGLNDSVIYNESKVKERYNLTPDKIIDFKALRGDPSDNIPGVKGIGEKTAVELINEFGDLENLYKNLDSKKISPRIKELLEKDKDKAFLSQELSRIDRDVNIDFSLDACIFGDYDKEKIINLFSELEFKSLLVKLKELNELYGLVQINTSQARDDYKDKFERNKKLFKYKLIDNEKAFLDFLKVLIKQTSFTFDTETSDLDNFTAELLGISFSWQEGDAYFVKITNKKEANNLNLFNYKSSEKENTKNHIWLEKLKPIFKNEAIKKSGHNLKFDLKVLSSFGIEVNGVDFDSMIASYLLNPDNRQHNLDSVVFTEFGFEKISTKDLLGEKKNKISFSEVDTKKLSLYSCEDADFSNRLVVKLGKELVKEKLTKIFIDLEMPLVKILAEMENNGIKINQEHFKKIDKEVDSSLKNLQKEIWQLAGEEFNINSVQQLREILFNKLQISSSGVSRTKTGFSTGAEELLKLKGHHKIIDLILDYRELNKLSNTYIKTLPELVNKKTGRIHTNYNQTVAATGRLSSNDPNLQNIPVKSDLGKKIREGFISDNNCKLFSLDYSQIELRVAAHLAQDKKMISYFLEGYDIHKATAADVNQVSLDEVTKEMRRNAKAVNFGVLYGQGAHGLSQSAEITYAEAKQFIDKYFLTFPDIKKYIEETIDRARQDGFVETLFGRKRYIADINSSMTMVRRAAERMAVNTPIQGTAADMIKLAMIKVNDYLNTNKLKDNIKMLLQVHDELLFEVKMGSEGFIAEIKKIMEDVMSLDTPIEVEVREGDSWGEMTVKNL